MEDEKWRLILHSGSRHSLWIIGGQNWCSYAQIASWLPNSQAQLIHIHMVLYFPYISWHQKKMKEMCSTRITFHLFCFNFHFASLAFPLQLYISSVFLEHVFHFHTQYFFPYFFPLSQMIVSIIVALLLRSKGSCSTCSECTYKSCWWMVASIAAQCVVGQPTIPAARLATRNYNSGGQYILHILLFEVLSNLAVLMELQADIFCDFGSRRDRFKTLWE